MITAPLFPFMARSAMARVLELLAERGAVAVDRSCEPGRYLVAFTRPGELAPSKAIEVWGRGFIRGFCSAAELERWTSGAGGVAIQCQAIGLDYQLRDEFHARSGS